LANLPNLRHLLVLRSVRRFGTASAAARAVHRSQPAVTQAIQQMEAHFGVRLFERGPLGMATTGMGEAVLGRVDRALEQLAQGLCEAQGREPGGEPEPLQRLTGQQLHALMALDEHRSFASAAQVLGLPRPNVHRAARELERTVGVPLFERTSFGVNPTRAAGFLARRARLALTELDQAHAEISTDLGTSRGGTIIGAMPLARSSLVPATVLDFSTLHPEHGLSILDGPYETLLEALRQGRADLLVGALRDPPPAADVIQEHLFDDPLALVVRAGHPLTAKRHVKLSDLARFSWIAPRLGSPLRRHFDALTAAIGAAAPARPIECNSLVAARALLIGSDRLLMLSRHQVQYELQAGHVVTLKHPMGDITRPIGLTVRADWHPTRLQAVLLNQLRTQAMLYAGRDPRGRRPVSDVRKVQVRT
jgi:LysR family transcriptional regulator, regulator for genes of the gallate degradation pathway